MSLSNPVLGEGFVPAYQISAIPYVTSSNIALGEIKEFDFDFVTRFFTVKNKSGGSSLAIGFTQRGLSNTVNNFFTVSGGESYTGELRTSRLFLSGSAGASINFELVAGLTNIPVRNFLTITGSNGYTGVG
jgi:hypothetical protein